MIVYGQKVNQLARLFVKRLNEGLEQFDFYSAQWAFALRLHQQGSSTQKELSDYLNIEPPTVTRTLARMEKAGLVIREQGIDRRERKISLSPVACEQFATWQQTSNQLETIALANIDKSELEVFTRVLEQMVDNLKKT
jgi:DNA-binding MarR family transcriptional regulator